MRKISEMQPADDTAGAALPAPAERKLPPIEITGHPRLGKCACGSESFVLVSELDEEALPGIRPSRMYECISCGDYRLG